VYPVKNWCTLISTCIQSTAQIKIAEITSNRWTCNVKEEKTSKIKQIEDEYNWRTIFSTRQHKKAVNLTPTSAR
jgi:rRNA maturation protein Rpf1